LNIVFIIQNTNKYNDVRSEAFRVAEVDEIFLGYQPWPVSWLNIIDVSETISIPNMRG
jgi:hypothetical protein